MNLASTTEIIPQRKRVGRPPKVTSNKANRSCVKMLDGSALAISPTPNERVDTGNVVAAGSSGGGECRRSSRKKIIKFDVRDLLNKHRKPHKIQIEARIDSNAPHSPKQTTSNLAIGGNTSAALGNVATSDLSSKQKAFMEKSAIFRRISISEQHNKINAPPRPPPLSSMPKINMLGKPEIDGKSKADVLATMDPSKIAQARRLSRTQEIFNASLMKSKQNSSLIVAQIENNSSSSSSGIMSQMISTLPQKRVAAGKRKNITNSFMSHLPVANIKHVASEPGVVQKRRGRPPKNKILSPQSISNTKSGGKKITAEIIASGGEELQPPKDIAPECLKNVAISKVASNWKEYKANLGRTANTQKSSVKMLASQRNVEKNDDVILEISSTSSVSDHEYQQKAPVKEANESQQRNFASVCIWQESPSVCDRPSAPEFIVAAVEEITVETTHASKIIPVESSSTLNSLTTTETMIESIEIEEINPDVVVESDNLMDRELYSSPEIQERECFGSYKLSGSESETSSERSNKHYKKGDKLRVSLKRLTMSQNSAITTISSSPVSSSCSDALESNSNNTNNTNNCAVNNGSNNNEFGTVIANTSTAARRSPRLPKQYILNNANIEMDNLKPVYEKLNKEQYFTDNSHKIDPPRVEHNLSTGKVNELSVELNSSNIAVSVTDNFDSSHNEMKITTKLGTPIDSNCEVIVSNQQAVKPQPTIRHIPETKLKVLSQQCDIAGTEPVCIDNEMPKPISPAAPSTVHTHDIPLESTAVRKEPITLPLKKQVNKFKAYEASVHNAEKSILSVETDVKSVKDTGQSTETIAECTSRIIQAVNVETSTLLDILNTVKQNNLTQIVQNQVELKEGAPISDSSQIMSPTKTQAADDLPSDITLSLTSGQDSNYSMPRNTYEKVVEEGIETDICETESPLVEFPNKDNIKSSKEITYKRPELNVPLLSLADNAAKGETILESQVIAEQSSVSTDTQPTAPLDIQVSKAMLQEKPLLDIIAERVIPLPREEPIIEEISRDKCSELCLQISSEKASDQHNASEDKIMSAFESQVIDGSAPTVLELTAWPETQLSPGLSASEIAVDHSRTEEVKPKCDSEQAVERIADVAMKSNDFVARRSPLQMENSLSSNTKKPTRRYERRSQRGDVSAHKTLEETFAEIAAESSKAVLDLKAREVEMPIGIVEENSVHSLAENRSIESGLNQTISSTKEVQPSVDTIQLENTVNIDAEHCSAANNEAECLITLHISSSKVQNIAEVSTIQEQYAKKDSLNNTLSELGNKDSRSIVEEPTEAKNVENKPNISSPHRQRKQLKNKQIPDQNNYKNLDDRKSSTSTIDEIEMKDETSKKGTVDTKPFCEQPATDSNISESLEAEPQTPKMDKIILQTFTLNPLETVNVTCTNTELIADVNPLAQNVKSNLSETELQEKTPSVSKEVQNTVHVDVPNVVTNDRTCDDLSAAHTAQICPQRQAKTKETEMTTEKQEMIVKHERSEATEPYASNVGMIEKDQQSNGNEVNVRKKVMTKKDDQSGGIEPYAEGTEAVALHKFMSTKNGQSEETDPAIQSKVMIVRNDQSGDTDPTGQNNVMIVKSNVMPMRDAQFQGAEPSSQKCEMITKDDLSEGTEPKTQNKEFIIKSNQSELAVHTKKTNANDGQIKGTDPTDRSKEIILVYDQPDGPEQVGQNNEMSEKDESEYPDLSPKNKLMITKNDQPESRVLKVQSLQSEVGEEAEFKLSKDVLQKLIKETFQKQAEIPASKSVGDSCAEQKICYKISNETPIYNVDNIILEQNSELEMSLDKLRKAKKRKGTKQTIADSAIDGKGEANLQSPVHAAESRKKANTDKFYDPEVSTGRPRTQKKGSLMNELVKENERNTTPECTNTLPVVVDDKEFLAKAPPKKRLLKMQMELEAKAACVSTNVELPTTSIVNVDTKTLSAKKCTPDANKPKKAKKQNQLDLHDELKKRLSFESQTESSFDEESRSATSTPIAKGLKHQKIFEKASEDKGKLSGKRKTKLDKSLGKSEKNTSKMSKLKEKQRNSSLSDKTEKKKSSDAENTVSPDLGKQKDEKSAKKKRQKKLKEAFEAALNDSLAGTAENCLEMASKPLVPPEVNNRTTEEEQNWKPPSVATLVSDDKPTTTTVEAIHAKVPEVTVISEPEEVPDPLKDIEKFIEDGVNLLKRGYKIDDDSVDEVICPKLLLEKGNFNPEPTKQIETVTPVIESTTTFSESLSNELAEISTAFTESTTALSPHVFFETPANTPLATPSTTPPPKSPVMDLAADEKAGVRRSHRIKQITKAPKALVGRGLVRDKERFSIKDDVEMKTHYSLDDHLTDLAEVEAKNAKFLKEMEERLSNFQVIKDNEYKCERVVSREARKMLCDCFLTAEEEERGELGCGEDCLNRLLMIECGPDCNVKDRCTNKRFQKLLCSPCRVFRTEKKGFGIMADIEILPGEFIMEYVGEVIDGDEFERRRTAYSLDKNRHYYFMALRSDAIIDATIKGNISRFINHSCDPNAETQKWTVNGELRIGFFSRKSIMPGEEITFDYQYQRYGREAQRCYCESVNCRGWIGEEPNSDEGEQIDEDSDVDNLADGSDEEESDDSTADGEDTHKKLEIDTTASKSAFGSEEDDKMKSNEKVDIAGKDKKKKLGEDERREDDEDLKNKLKKLTGKLTDKAFRKKRQHKTDKRRRTATSGEGTKTSRYLEDPDIEEEVKFLSRAGLRNQSDTLRFSRLVVRAKLPQTRLNLLKILRNAELPCRRLFLDYHGLRLLHGWMSEDGGDMAIRLSLLEALESLPIANKTVLTDSKVYQSVCNWCGNASAGGAPSTSNASSPSDESSKESACSHTQQETISGQEVPSELQRLAMKLTTAWNSLPEIFRIPKRERIEQMKEHEREADRQFAETTDMNRPTITDRYQRDRFGRGPTTSRYSKPCFSKDTRNNNITVVGSTPVSDPRRRSGQDSSLSMNDNMKHMSKEQRREMFAAKVARDEAEKRMAEERREFETKCRFFGLDAKKTRPQDVPFCVDPSTGQWYSVERQPIPTPPCYAHVQVQPKAKSTDPVDYKLPTIVSTLPPQWKFAITPQGQIYYYHVNLRMPQWQPPTPEQMRAAAEEVGSSDSESCEEAKIGNESSEDDDILIGMDEVQLKALVEKKVEARRQKRYNRLVDERPISPRKEEDRIYNQMEMRKYKENKEKIRKRKEEIRRKRAETLKAQACGSVNGNSTVESTNVVEGKMPAEANAPNYKNGAGDSDEPGDAIPIQDYLLSSDEEDMLKAECDSSPLLDKIVQGDKIVDEVDALTTSRVLKRPLPPHRDLNTQPGPNSSGAGGSDHKRRKSEKKEKSKKSKDSDSKYRRNKEKFRCEIAGIIVQHLKPYRKDACPIGRIQSNEDFNHLARKLTHFVMVKELKYCESVGQTLIVTESVKNKSREFIKKYMAKYGGLYVKPANDPEFKEIPFTI